MNILNSFHTKNCVMRSWKLYTRKQYNNTVLNKKKLGNIKKTIKIVRKILIFNFYLYSMILEHIIKYE